MDRAIGRGTKRRLIAVTMTAGLLLAACGSSPSGSSSTTSTTVSTAIPSQQQSAAEVDAAYSTLFDLADPAIAPKLAVVQNGQQLKGLFQSALKTSLAKQAVGAKVLSVKLYRGSKCGAEQLTSPCASVSYQVTGKSGKPLLSQPFTGWALYSGGHWLVAKATICGLLGLVIPGAKGC